MTRPFRSLLVAVCAASLALTACDGNGSSASSPSSGAPTSPHAASSSPTDAASPYLVYSPPPPPSGPITSGYLGSTLTLDVGNGQHLRLTFHSTAMDAVAALYNQPRQFNVWLTVENPNDTSWKGNLGPLAHVDDDIGGNVAVDPSPAPGLFSSSAKRLGYSNRNLAKPIVIPAGGSVDGALLFQMYGGNRVVYITIDSPANADPIIWETNLGIF